jgi:hypothetical protein
MGFKVQAGCRGISRPSGRLSVPTLPDGLNFSLRSDPSIKAYAVPDFSEASKNDMFSQGLSFPIRHVTIRANQS